MELPFLLKCSVLKSIFTPGLAMRDKKFLRGCKKTGIRKRDKNTMRYFARQFVLQLAVEYYLLELTN